MQQGVSATPPPLICVYRMSNEALTVRDWENAEARTDQDVHHAMRAWLPFSLVGALFVVDSVPHVYGCTLVQGNQRFGFVHPDSVPAVEYVIAQSKAPPPPVSEYTLTDAVMLLVQELQCNPDAGRLARHAIDRGQEALAKMKK